MTFYFLFRFDPLAARSRRRNALTGKKRAVACNVSLSSGVKCAKVRSRLCVKDKDFSVMCQIILEVNVCFVVLFCYVCTFCIIHVNKFTNCTHIIFDWGESVHSVLYRFCFYTLIR